MERRVVGRSLGVCCFFSSVGFFVEVVVAEREREGERGLRVESGGEMGISVE